MIGRPHGVRGLVHVISYTADPATLAAYGPLIDETRAARSSLRWRGEGVAELPNWWTAGKCRWPTATAAEQLVNTAAVCRPRDRLPAPDEDEFYLADLVGLPAVDAAGRELGTVSRGA